MKIRYPIDDYHVSSVKIENSIDILKQSLLSYQDHELAIAFNGGKDSMVLLQLLKITIDIWNQTMKDHNGVIRNLSSIIAIFLFSEDSFEEMIFFMEKIAQLYHLTTYVEKSSSMKLALFEFNKNHPNIKGIYMGTRRNDPFSENLAPFTETDVGWPKYMRIHPILDWGYYDVWSYILSDGIEYCDLYNRGYSSIGGKKYNINQSIITRK